MEVGDRKNLAGFKFGKLLVLCEKGKNKWGQYKWLCKCECGNKGIVTSGNLSDGSLKGCACEKKNVSNKDK